MKVRGRTHAHPQWRDNRDTKKGRGDVQRGGNRSTSKSILIKINRRGEKEKYAVREDQ